MPSFDGAEPPAWENGCSEHGFVRSEFGEKSSPKAPGSGTFPVSGGQGALSKKTQAPLREALESGVHKVESIWVGVLPAVPLSSYRLSFVGVLCSAL